ncbi:MAG: hypothetical protein HC905_32085 [Bacteroidales bacterium]|nr:hypothetical protein [Bacteroidales bacterium]
MKNCFIILLVFTWNYTINGQNSITKIYKYDTGLIKERITYTAEYKDNNNQYIENGLYTSYYPTSKTNFSILGKNQDLLKKETGNFKYGLKDGYWIEYYPPQIINNNVTPGQIKSEGNYLGCNKIGIWKYYNENGIITEEDHKFSLKFPPDFYPCNFVYQKSEKLNIIIKYSINEDCSIDSIEYITNRGNGHDEAALFKSIKRHSFEEFWTYKADTSSTGKITFKRVILSDKNYCKPKTVIDTIRTEVVVPK